MIKRKLTLIIPLALLFVACTGCRKQQLASQWCDQEIMVDGNSDEWKNRLAYFDDNKTGIGIVNDDKFLYLNITSNDRHIASQIKTAGFTVLFKNSARKNNTFGILFPLGGGGPSHEQGSGPPQQRTGEQQQGARSMSPDPAQNFNGTPPDTAQMMELTDAVQQTLSIVNGKDTIPMSLKIADSFGIQVQVKQSQDHFSYELRVPLNSDSSHDYAIGTGNDSLITVTLRTNEMTKPSGAAGSGGPGGGMSGGSGGPPQGGGPGGGGPPPGGGGNMGGSGGSGGPGGSSSASEESINYKIDLLVTLAKKH